MSVGPFGLARLRPPAVRLSASPSTTVLTLTLAGALLVRVAVIGRSLWLDETISVLQADRPVGEVVRGQVDGVHPPLFHVLLHVWIGLVGTAPEALRVIPIAWSLVAVVAIVAWSREAVPTLSPWPAAGCAAFAPFTVWYGTEVRMYSQLFALVAVSGWLAWRIMNRGVSPGRLAMLAAALVAVVYTHYFATFFVASLGAVALGTLLVEPERRRGCLAVTGACAGAGLALVPWVVYVVAHRQAQPLTTVFDDPNVFSALIAFLQMLTGFRSFAQLGLAAAAWPLLCLLAILLAPQLGTMRWRVWGLLVLFLAPPALLAALSVVASRSAFDSRYLTVCAAPLYLLAGAAWQRLVPRRAAPWLAGLAIAAAGTAAVWQNYDPANPKLYELGQAIATIDAHAQRGDALMLVPQVDELGAKEPILSYYRLRSGVRIVDTTPDGRPGTIAPALAWRALRQSRPGRIFVLSGFDALTYRVGRRSVTGREVAQRYDRFIDARATQLARLGWANVTVRVYRPDWSRP